jgi:hypothetical protein
MHESARNIERRYRFRNASTLTGRLVRLLQPLQPFVMNPREQIEAPLGRWNLYIGGASNGTPAMSISTCSSSPAWTSSPMPNTCRFATTCFNASSAMPCWSTSAIPSASCGKSSACWHRGYAHIVAPFCHPFHEYPRDFRRFTPDGPEELTRNLTPVATGWRTGPTATLLVFILE